MAILKFAFYFPLTGAINHFFSWYKTQDPGHYACVHLGLSLFLRYGMNGSLKGSRYWQAVCFMEPLDVEHITSFHQDYTWWGHHVMWVKPCVLSNENPLPFFLLSCCTQLFCLFSVKKEAELLCLYKEGKNSKKNTNGTLLSATRVPITSCKEPFKSLGLFANVTSLSSFFFFFLF